MNGRLSFLEYSFMFDPASTFSHAHEFEKAFSDFFKTKGLEARIVNTVGGTPGSRKILHVKTRGVVDQIADGQVSDEVKAKATQITQEARKYLSILNAQSAERANKMKEFKAGLVSSKRRPLKINTGYKFAKE